MTHSRGSMNQNRFNDVSFTLIETVIGCSWNAFVQLAPVYAPCSGVAYENEHNCVSDYHDKTLFLALKDGKWKGLPLPVKNAFHPLQGRHGVTLLPSTSMSSRGGENMMNVFITKRYAISLNRCHVVA